METTDGRHKAARRTPGSSVETAVTNAMPESSPYARIQPQLNETYMREIARRRWISQQEQARRQARRQQVAKVTDRVTQIRRLRPGRAVANSLSPVYSMFNDSFFRGR